ncbi:MAG TPA: ABC transporter permease [Dehalococcoidales bacterium]|nr:ABC transporter permease [Dehalococcoidales bacterium]
MNKGTRDTSVEMVRVTKRRSGLVRFLIRLAKEKPLGAVGAVITLLLLLTGSFADFIAPYGMNECWVGDFLGQPSAQFWLGTDNLGRDLLSRVIFGARVSVIVGLAASTLATVISALIGIVSGYLGGKVDLIIQRGVDAWMCLPGLVVLILLVSIIGASMWSIIIVLGISWGIGGSRIIRGAAINIKEDVYLQAAQVIGCSTTRILTRHVLPNVMATLIVLFSVRVPGIILAEASLSFLGFGIPPPAPSWGGMLSGTGRKYMFMAPWMAIWPGLALAITVYSINMFGDAVRDLLDPRLRGGVGRYGVRKLVKEEKGG